MTALLGASARVEQQAHVDLGATTGGTYSFQVWLRNAGSDANLDAWLGAGPAAVSQPEPLAVTALTVPPVGPLVTGSPAVVTASAIGGSGPTPTSGGCWTERTRG